MEETRHTLTDFEEALIGLRRNVLTMASLTTSSLQNALRGLRDRNNDLCRRVIADDEKVDQLEIEIDRDGLEILLRFQPVACDLRRVVSAMKISPNLERIGDESVNIARRARELNQPQALPETDLISSMGAYAMEMFQSSIDAYRRGDAELARSLRERDKTLDEMNSTALRRLVARVPDDPDHLRGYLDLTFIAAHLERIGDHATNIGEETVYAAEAEDIRHPPHQVA
jgi:phosphate transport system protein